MVRVVEVYFAACPIKRPGMQAANDGNENEPGEKGSLHYREESQTWVEETRLLTVRLPRNRIVGLAEEPGKSARLLA
jgi:hypothetical protein